MTIATATPRVAYQMDGTTTTFPIPFPFQATAHIAAVITDVDGNDTQLTAGTDFTVTGPTGGDVGFLKTPARSAAFKLTVYLDPPIDQATLYVPNDPFPAKSHERALDKLTLIALVLADRFSRTFSVPQGEAGSGGLKLPGRGSRKGKLLGFDKITGDAKVVDGSDFKGDPGPAGNVAGDLFQLKAAAITNIAMIFAGAAYAWVPGNYTGRADDVTVVQHATVPIETGAWVMSGVLDSAPVRATKFGMKATNSAADNMVALKKAYQATPTGGTLVIPAGIFPLDVTGGLANAVLIDRQITVQLDGRLVANADASTSPGTNGNPAMFKVTAPDVTFTGTGRLAGTGNYSDANSGDAATHPTFIWVSGDSFLFDKGLTIDGPYKAGISLIACYSATIRGKWRGLVSAYGDTSYFGVVASGGGMHSFERMIANRTATGGRFVNLIFTAGSSGEANACTVRNCYADVWEKLIYGYGNGHLIIDNDGIGNRTDFIRMIGSNNRAYRNKCSGSNGGVSAYDGTGIEICDNTFTGCKQIGIYVDAFPGHGYAGGYDGLKIVGNTLIGDGASIQLTDGIRVYVQTGNTSGITIDNNRVENFALGSIEGMIRVVAVSPYSIDDLAITRNRLKSTGKSGIIVNRVINSRIESNKGTGIGLAFLNEIDGAYNRWLNNTGKTIGQIGINGVSTTSEGRGNRYTDAPLQGVATLSAAVSSTIAHGGVAPNARIFINSASNVFGVMTVAKGFPRTLVSATPGAFDITMANGTAAAGTEVFSYDIQQ